MKTEEARSIIDLIKNSTFGELFFTSLIILPIYLGSWIVVLKQLETSLWGIEIEILLILLISYIITLGIMKIYQSKDDKIHNASRRIRSYIISRNWKRMSYERIMKNIDKNYDEELLNAIINKYPDDFRIGTIIGGKIAIVILGEEEEA